MFCPNCGTKLDDDAVFCTSCGVRLAQDQASEQTASEPVWQDAPVQEPASQEVWQSGAPSGSEPPPQAAPMASPPDYLTINIILTVVSFFACCFGIISLITGIIGIVNSAGVRSAMNAGNYALAEQKSRTAKNLWIATAIILGVSIIFGIVLAAMGFSNYLDILMSYYY
jgi:hypothetical protein